MWFLFLALLFNPIQAKFDEIIFSTLFLCNLKNNASYIADIKFIEIDHRKIDDASKVYHEIFPVDGKLLKRFVVVIDGDGFGGSYYEFGVEIGHNCTDNGRYQNVTLKFDEKKKCETGRNCHVMVGMDLTNTYSSIWNYYPVTVYQ